MTEPTEPRPSKQRIPPDLQTQVEDIQKKVPRTTDTSVDLEEEKKRWLIVGICLHSIISPLLRKYVDPIISKLYNSLVSSDSIDTQGYNRYLKKYPAANRYLFNYESINNNRNVPKKKMSNKWINDYQAYDYKVTSHVDLSKLFLQPSMAHYSAIDASCDSSALLGMVINISSFQPVVQSDAEKIRSDIRNPWAHCDFTEWTTAKYADSFQLMEQLVKDLGLYNRDENRVLGELNTWATNGQNFLSGTVLGLEIVNDIHQQTQILSEYVLTLCTEADSQFIEVQQELKKLENSLQERMRNLESKTKEHGEELNNLKEEMRKQAEDHIPKHIRDQHDIYISEWKQDTISFVETRATHHLLSCLPLNNCIVVTGSSGCGKSSNIHLAALTLNEKFDYEIIPVLTGPEDILNYYNENKRQVFVVDDICGKELINTPTLHKWRDNSEKFEKIFPVKEKDFANKHDGTILKKSSAKLLMSCRLHIYKESQFQLVTLFTRKECNLLSDELCLLPEERICIAKKYLPREILEDVKQYMQDVDFFPLLCKLSKDKSFEEVKKLFTDPVQCITQNINHIVYENKSHFCALVLCILFDDGFNTNWLKIKSAPEGIKCKLEGIVKEYDIDLSKEMSRNSLKTSFTTLDGTYLKGRGTEYRIIHDIIYKMAAVICGRHLKECFIKYAPSVFIRDHFIFESLTENQAYDDLIVISEDQEEDYFERLLYDLRESVITSTFHNAQLIYQSFMDKLIIFFDGSENAKTCLKDMDSERRTGKGESYKNMNVFKTTPLLESASRGYFSIVHFLIYDLEYCVNNTDEGGRSPLYKASEGGHLKVVRLLLENNAVPRCDDFGDSPLYVACRGGHVDTVELLLQNKVNGDCEGEPDDNQLFRQMESPLHVACKGGHTDTVQLLLQHNANVNEKDVDGQSPLHVASYYGHTDIVKLLLQNNAKVNSKDGDERYPLHIASEEGHTDTVKLLLQYNAHVSDCNGLDESSLDVAFHRRHFETMKVLLKSSDDYSLRCYGQFGNHFSCGQQYTELDKLFNLSSSFGLDLIMDLIVDKRLQEEYRQHFQTRTHDLDEKKDVRLYEVPYPFGFDVIIDSRLSVKRSEADFDKQLLNLSVEELIEKLAGHQV